LRRFDTEQGNCTTGYTIASARGLQDELEQRERVRLFRAV